MGEMGSDISHQLAKVHDFQGIASLGAPALWRMKSDGFPAIRVQSERLGLGGNPIGYALMRNPGRQHSYFNPTGCLLESQIGQAGGRTRPIGFSSGKGREGRGN